MRFEEERRRKEAEMELRRSGLVLDEQCERPDGDRVSSFEVDTRRIEARRCILEIPDNDLEIGLNREMFLRVTKKKRRF
jgi:hypothetical protein